MSKFENEKQTNHLDFWGLCRADGKWRRFESLQSSANFAGPGGVTFIVGSSRAAMSTFLNYMPSLSSAIEATAVPLSEKLRVQDRLSRWRWSKLAGRKEFAKEEGVSVEELEEKLKAEAELLEAQEVLVTGIDFLFSVGGRPAVRVHHGRWDMTFDVLKEIFEGIKQEYLAPQPKQAPTPAPADTPADTPDF